MNEMGYPKIKISVLGCSSIAERSILPSIVRSDDFELVSVGSRSPEKSRRFAETFGCRAQTYHDVAESSEAGAVYVSLPVALHYEWGKKVLSSKKHLLLEKTFTDSFEKAWDLCKLAVTNGVKAVEALMYVYHPLHKKTREIASSGYLGTIRQVDAFMAFPFLPSGDIRNNKQLGGGAILDCLVYPLSFALDLAEEDMENISFKTHHDNRLGIDARGHIRIDWPGFSANLTYGFGFMYRNSYTIWGDKGYLEVNRAFSRPSALEGSIRVVRQSGEESVMVDPADHFDLMLKGFADKIRGRDGSSVNESADILKRMKIITDIYNHHYRMLNGEVHDG